MVSFYGVPALDCHFKIDPVQIVGMRFYVCACMCVCVCVCPYLKLLITNGVMWTDMDLIRLAKQILQLLYSNCSHYC